MFSKSQLFGFGYGAFLVIYGVVGFLATQGVDIAESEGGEFLGIFALNPLHNFAHIVIGTSLVLAVGIFDQARIALPVAGVFQMVVGVLGLFLVGRTINLLAVNHADNALHLAAGALTLGLGVLFNRSELAREQASTPRQTPLASA